MKRAVAYARYSSDRQSDTSIEAQIEHIERYCKEKGYNLVKHYIDRAQSAATDKRVAFQQMIKDAENNLFDVIVVYKLDRFARNLYDSVVYTKRLEECGVALESVTEPITQDVAGKFFRNIMGAINELYIENLKQEIRDKAIVVAKKGYFMGGKPPFGYDLQEITDEYGKRRKVYVINESEAVWVRKIFELASQGYSLGYIADFLNEKGVKTRRGGNWTIRALYELLLNEKYAGIYVYQKGTKHNYHAKRADTIRLHGVIPAIISLEQYQQARQRLKIGQRQNKKHEYALKRLAYCSVCGAPLTVGSGGKYPRYACSKAKRERLNGHVVIARKKLEDYVYTHIKHTFLKDVDFEELAREVNKLLAKENQYKEKQYQKLQEELAEIEVKLKRATEAILNGIDLDLIKEEIAKLKARKIEIEQEKVNLEGQEAPEVVSPEGLRTLWSEIEQMLEQDKELVFKTLIEKVIVHTDGFVEITYRNVTELI